MLTILTDGHPRTCQGYTRREMLQVGTLGFGGWMLSDVLAATSCTMLDRLDQNMHDPVG